MILIALTGGIGSGKSRAAAILEELGANSISADHLAKEVLEPGQIGYNEVVAYFGDQILSDGQIDRKKLAEVVFNDSVALQKLESITHPMIREAFAKKVKKLPEDAVVIYEIPLYVESLAKEKSYHFDHIIVIESQEELRISRLLERGMTVHEAKVRIENQAQDEERKKIATHLINNESSIQDLQQALEFWWNQNISPNLAK